jgi:2-methylaconitate cis-trans-isomerase PrpF
VAPLSHRSLEEHGVKRQLEYERDELILAFVDVLRTAAPALIAMHSSAESSDTNSNARPVALAATAASKHKLGGRTRHLESSFFKKKPEQFRSRCEKSRP